MCPTEVLSPVVLLPSPNIVQGYHPREASTLLLVILSHKDMSRSQLSMSSQVLPLLCQVMWLARCAASPPHPLQELSQEPR